MNTLIIKNIPSKLSYKDREELFRHFGAQSVTNLPNYSFAVFANEYKSREAMTRLHQLSVFDQRLRVEITVNQKTSQVSQLPSLNEPHIQRRLNEESVEAFKETKLRQFLTQLDYISPALGLNYLPSPLLKYSYPSATPQIINRIARTLVSHPKFYIQVLHLMNKMSLPVPFQSFDSSEELVLKSFETTIINEKSVENDLSSDESELDISDTRANILTTTPKPIKKVIKRLKTGFVGEKAIVLQQNFELKRKQSPKRTAILPQIFKCSNICEQKTKIAVNIVTDFQKLNQKIVSTVDESSVESSGFGVITAESQKHSEIIDEIVWDINNIISDEELSSNRLSQTKWPQYKVFRNYSTGQVSVRLYVKNIDKSVETNDLMRIFAKFIDWNLEEHRNMFDIRLMKTGRMKGQAFISLPNESIAQKALNETNGYLFNEKPIIVSFARCHKP